MGNAASSGEDLLDRLVGDQMLSLTREEATIYWESLFSSLSSYQGGLDTPKLCSKLSLLFLIEFMFDILLQEILIFSYFII